MSGCGKSDFKNNTSTCFSQKGMRLLEAADSDQTITMEEHKKQASAKISKRERSKVKHKDKEATATCVASIKKKRKKGKGNKAGMASVIDQNSSISISKVDHDATLVCKVVTIIWHLFTLIFRLTIYSFSSRKSSSQWTGPWRKTHLDVM